MVLSRFPTGRPRAEITDVDIPNPFNPPSDPWVLDAGLRMPTFPPATAGDIGMNGTTGRPQAFIDGAARGLAHVDEELFGKDYQSSSADARTTTTSSSFQPKVALTTGPLAGTYRVAWAAVVDNASSLGEFRLRNTTDSATVGIEQVFKATDAAERVAVGGFAEVVFTGAAKTFEIQFCDQAGGNTQGIQAAKIELWRLS